MTSSLSGPEFSDVYTDTRVMQKENVDLKAEYVGVTVKVRAMPNDISSMPTDCRKAFERALGNEYVVQEIDNVGHLHLHVGHPEDYMESIFIEPEYVSVVDTAGAADE